MAHDVRWVSSTSAELDVLGSKISARVPPEDTGGADATVASLDRPGAGSPPPAHMPQGRAITGVPGKLEVERQGRSI